MRLFIILRGDDYYTGYGFAPIKQGTVKWYHSINEVRKAYEEIHKTFGLGLLHECKTVEVEQ
jgi:hypothetical protein